MCKIFPVAALENILVGVFEKSAVLADGLWEERKDFDSAFLDRLAAVTGLSYQIYYGTYGECVKKLDNGSLDLIMGVPRGSETADRFLYPHYGYYTTFHLLIAPLHSSAYYAGDVSELNNADIGLVDGAPDQKLLLDSFATAHALKFRYRFYKNSMALERDFSAGRISLKFVQTNRISEKEKIIRNFGSCPLYIVTSSANQPLYKKIDSAISFIYRHQYFDLTHDQLSTSDFRVVSADNITPEEHDYIRTISSIYVPANYDLNNVWEYLHDIVNLNFIPKARSVQADSMIRVTPVPFLSVPDQTDSGTYTKPVYSTIQWIVVAPGVVSGDLRCNSLTEKFSGKLRIAFDRHLSDVILFYRHKLQPFDAVFFDSISKCLNAVSEGRCDAAIIPDSLLDSNYNLNDYPELKHCELLKFKVPYCFQVTGASDKLVSVLNKAADQIPDDFYAQQMRKIARESPYHLGIAFIRQWNRRLVGIAIGLAVFFWILSLVRQECSFKKWAFTDDLTGLWNSRRFEVETEKILKKNRNGNYAIIDSDIRGFKYVNQIYGTEYGDRLLRSYAESLKRYQPADTFIARSYADRFYIMFPIESLQDCSYKCVQLLNWCSTDAAEHGFHYMIKDGIALVGKNFGFDSVRNLIGNANYAKCTIKHDLVTSLAFFDESMKKQMNFDQQVESRMDKAFENNEFFVVYQPKIDLKTERITGAEALVRWNNPEKGLLPPDEFLPILERNGYITKLDFYVYRKVFEFLQHMLDKGVLLVPISVNMSRFHLNAPDFIHDFTYLFSQYKIPPSFIEIEVVERASGEKDRLLMSVTKQLQKAGFLVAMDDFGSGESSLNMLHTIPVNILKMDKQFLYRAEDSSDSKVIITKVMEMARELGKETVCEGVETEQQVAFLKSVGCDMAQGFYYSKPLSELDFKNYLETHIR